MSDNQLTLYSDALGPNGWKVAMVLNSLGIRYRTIMVDVFGDSDAKDHMSKSDFVAQVNPNGRIPAIIDHTADDFVLWESVAIIQYVTRKFDTGHRFSYADDKRAALVDQYLLYQASGQGPYFGQATWFVFYHSEKNLTSVLQRYRDEIRRVNGVLEQVLKKNGSGWLVGDKCTVADLSFVIWTEVIVHWTPTMGGKDFDLAKEFPTVDKWYKEMLALPGVQSVTKEREQLEVRFK